VSVEAYGLVNYSLFLSSPPISLSIDRKKIYFVIMHRKLVPAGELVRGGMLREAVAQEFYERSMRSRSGTWRLMRLMRRVGGHV
jgi:hypothetical protein